MAKISFSPKIATNPVIKLVKIVGKRMLLAFVLPELALSPIIVVGKSCKEMQFKIKSIVIALFIFPLPSSRPCIALIADGVAMLPSPKILLLKFSAICIFVSWFIPFPHSQSIGFESAFASFFDSPVFCRILIIPSQKA